MSTHENVRQRHLTWKLFGRHDLVCEDPTDVVEGDLASISETIESFKRVTLAGRLSSIEGELLSLREAVEILSGTVAYVAPVHTLLDSGLRLKQTIFATVTVTEEGFLCELPECNLGATGETKFEAIENLKDIIEATFRRLSKAKASKLGPVPARQIETLRQLIES